MTTAQILNKARDEKRTVLTEIEAKQILGKAGINCTPTVLADTKEQAIAISEQIGYPVVLKVSSVDITHKSDAGGVKVNLKNGEAVARAYDEIISSCRNYAPEANIEGVAVQKMARPGTEIIMGMIKDPSFGPVVMFGLGGVLVEVLKDVSFRIVPIEKADAEDMTREIQGRKLLEGYRGQEPADVPCLQDMLVKLSDFVDRTPGIEEIDMNPVFAYSDGAVVVDARIILS
ncbi:acetate--CoA ligase family protein [Desulforhopalus singaporensis]|uniref:Acetyl-CoA synthetase (ADP-forming) n=1 Tax=Desulforhopalus singaporensis TaxID=91360 RepID=A0A1H0IUE3_9BACT|nr:acetate--CoA ligase family protein [Desulforhopalus singaporensis]SDO35025.1 acetyl-CoA synthetase (ADP-forming) [Desulforhopalus singaporensis]